jgi:hypothetical protein
MDKVECHFHQRGLFLSQEKDAGCHDFLSLEISKAKTKLQREFTRHATGLKGDESRTVVTVVTEDLLIRQLARSLAR